MLPLGYFNSEKIPHCDATSAMVFSPFKTFLTDAENTEFSLRCNATPILV